ncbi:MAG: 4Fe-4S binding protein [Planctomycetes bacterium]|nr:4Fe-4S binding protein [Planctomycetota bacterium]
MIRRLTGFASIAFAVVVFACPALLGAVNVPPPEFEGDYVLPKTEVPGPRENLLEYVDVSVLVLALSLSVYFVYHKRCRKGVFLLMMVSLVYFGFYRKGCICSIGAIGNVSLSLFENGYVIPFLALLFFVLPLVFTLFFGRTFCGCVCPLGALQDLVLLRPMKVARPVESVLRLLAYVYLGAAVWFAATGSAFIICRYDPFIGFFRRSGSINMIVFGACFLLVGVFVGRPYCRFLCPYGVILRQLSRLSKRKVTITPDECVKCRLCEGSCPFGAIETPTAEWPGETYRVNKKLLGVLILLLPVIAAVGVWAGGFVSGSASRVDARVRLADRIFMEDAGTVEGTIDASLAFRASGAKVEDLYSDADAIKAKFKTGGFFFGGFVALVIGLKLILLSIRFKREDYIASRAGCLACGRCYSYCPREHVRLGNVASANGGGDL